MRIRTHRREKKKESNLRRRNTKGPRHNTRSQTSEKCCKYQQQITAATQQENKFSRRLYHGPHYRSKSSSSGSSDEPSCELYACKKNRDENEYLVVHKASRWLDKRSGVFCFIKMHKIAASPPIIRRQTIILKNEFRPTFI